mmetsp:Transcript_13474/g.31901  ORF Transcript_13474/g.31901 Transcript_13474/m.31901 type:complete len:204 (-) Transcript_13474:153-764(-)
MCWPHASQPAQPIPSSHRCWSRAAHTAVRHSYGGACVTPSTPSGCAAVSRASEETRDSRGRRQSGPPPAARVRSTFCLASRATSRATGTTGRSGSSTAAAPRPSTRAGPTMWGSSCRSAGGRVASRPSCGGYPSSTPSSTRGGSAYRAAPRRSSGRGATRTTRGVFEAHRAIREAQGAGEGCRGSRPWRGCSVARRAARGGAT